MLTVYKCSLSVSICMKKDYKWQYKLDYKLQYK